MQKVRYFCRNEKGVVNVYESFHFLKYTGFFSIFPHGTYVHYWLLKLFSFREQGGPENSDVWHALL